MTTSNPPIPYISQWNTTTAYRRKDDCGQTCVAMLAAWVGKKVHVNSLPYQSTGTGISSAADLIMNFRHIKLDGVFARIKVKDLQPGDICLIQYKHIGTDHRQDKKFGGLHWLVFVAFEGDNVIVNDPNYYGKREQEGEYKRYPLLDFSASFTGQIVRMIHQVKAP